VKFEIVELDEFAGEGATVYSIALEEDEETLFDHFVEENEDLFPEEVDDIVRRIGTIALHGARLDYFKHKEGKLGAGDGVEALYDRPDSNLRLYCIRYGLIAVILGGGGYKPKTIRAFQEDPKLTEENYLLRKISLHITKAIKDGALYWENNRLEGQLLFNDETE
jgi:hypothetical protein